MSNYSSISSKWEAVKNRDPLAASEFVYCVKTTGIFCRPSCSARLARRSNVEFYNFALQAKEAGYRACKRCRPELPKWDPGVVIVDSACRFISTQVSKGEKISLEDLAQASGLTKWHFHRMFKKSTGFTPKDWAGKARQDFELSRQKSREERTIAVEADDGAMNDLYDSCLAFNESDSLELPEMWNGDLSAIPNISNTFLENYLIDGNELSYDSGTSTSTNSVATPASLPDLPNLSQICKIVPNESTGVSPLYYTIRETNYGHILIGLRDGKICILKMGFSESELINELRLKFPGSTIYSSSIFSNSTSESRTVEEEFEAYVDTILEALERPSGKTVDIPMNLLNL